MFFVGLKMDSQCNILNCCQFNKRHISDYCLSLSAPPNADNYVQIGQSETSITLQWNKLNNNSFILQFNGTEIHKYSSGSSGSLNHTVSNLTAGTRYTFTLFTVFENVSSSGVNLTAVTGKLCYSISTH